MNGCRVLCGFGMCVLLENTGGGSRFGYHWFIKNRKAGLVLSIKWVPPMVLKTGYEGFGECVFFGQVVSIEE